MPTAAASTVLTTNSAATSSGCASAITLTFCMMAEDAVNMATENTTNVVEISCSCTSSGVELSSASPVKGVAKDQAESRDSVLAYSSTVPETPIHGTGHRATHGVASQAARDTADRRARVRRECVHLRAGARRPHRAPRSSRTDVQTPRAPPIRLSRHSIDRRRRAAVAGTAASSRKSSARSDARCRERTSSREPLPPPSARGA